MQVIKYSPKIIKDITLALEQGKVVAYPTDTCYGLAVDIENIDAIKKLYKVKERVSTKPVHVIVPSIVYAKRLVEWNRDAQKLAKAFLPGPLTIVGKVKGEREKDKEIQMLSAHTGFLGVRMPDNEIAMAIVKKLGRPITTTSANPSADLSGGFDSYSASDVVSQFKDKKYKPDLIIDAGKLKKTKPSTLVKLEDGTIQILRVGPISETKIKSALSLRR